MERRTRDLVALFDDAARGVGSHIRARLARKRLERWLTSVIEDVRAARISAPEGSALAEVARHQGTDGQLLDARVAAVELLSGNVGADGHSGRFFSEPTSLQSRLR